MTPKERAVMQQALEALEELHYSSGTAKADQLFYSAFAALREVLEQSDVCNWRQPSYSDAECNAWQADCDQYWAITEGTPTENGMKFCHGCGKPIKEHPFVDEDDE